MKSIRLLNTSLQLSTEGGMSTSWDDEVCGANACVNIEEMDSGQFRHSMDIPSPYFKFIIGKKGETKRRLETETETQVTIPGHGKEGPIGKSNVTSKPHLSDLPEQKILTLA